MSGTAPRKIELKVHEMGDTTVISANDSCYRSVTQPNYDSVPDNDSVG